MTVSADCWAACIRKAIAAMGYLISRCPAYRIEREVPAVGLKPGRYKAVSEKSLQHLFSLGVGSAIRGLTRIVVCIWQTVFEDRHIAACVIRTFYSGDGLLQETSDESVGCLCWL
jgi:hypothetical protein